MQQEESLSSQIISTTNAPRGLLAQYIQLQCNKAKALPTAELLKVSGAGEFRDAVAPGEQIAAAIQQVLLQQSAVNWNDDKDLALVEDLAGELKTNPDRLDLWNELFERADKLSHS